MNQSLIGSVGTVVALGVIGLFAPNKPPAVPPSLPAAMTPQQQEALRQAFNAPPGSEIEVEIVNKDGGSVKTSEEGHGLGAGATAEGDKLSDQFTGTPPKVGKGADGSQSAEGGGSDHDFSGSALKIPPVPWQNPMFWMGLLALAGCGACVYFQLRRAALICGVAGIGLLVAAFYPVVLLFVGAGVALLLGGPYLWAEIKKRQAEQNASNNHEALRAVVAGVEHRDVPVEAQAAVKAAIAKEADAADKLAINAVKMADRIGKFAD